MTQGPATGPIRLHYTKMHRFMQILQFGKMAENFVQKWGNSPKITKEAGTIEKKALFRPNEAAGTGGRALT